MSICIIENSVNLKAKSSLVVNARLNASTKSSLVADVNVSVDSTRQRCNSLDLSTHPILEYNLSSDFNGSVDINCNFDLDISSVCCCSFTEDLLSSGIVAVDIDKFGPHFKELKGYDKLIPVQDIETDNFIGQDFDQLAFSDLHRFVDEGVFSCNYHETGDPSINFFDDRRFIRGSGDSNIASYKCRLSGPCVSFRDSLAVFRVGADFSNQRIYDIKFEDPSGNLICHYEDINFVGDGHFSTYIAKPIINNGALFTFDENYPIIENDSCRSGNEVEDRESIDISGRMGEFFYLRNFANNAIDEFTFSFKTSGSALYGYDPFSDGFDQGFEFSSDFDPIIKLSAVEIANSGDTGYRSEGIIDLYTEVQPTGNRIETCFNPSLVLSPDFDTNIYPDSPSVWEDQFQRFTNETNHGQTVLAQEVSKPHDFSNITLVNSDIPDSGKLNLSFSSNPRSKFAVSKGAFGLDFSESEFDTFRRQEIDVNCNWVTIDEVFLKVRAKKAIGSRDYTLDVVGWSDDGLLAVTSDVGGFLQNISGSGEIPLATGIDRSDFEALGGESISEIDSFFEKDLVSASGGDHYSLYQNVVNSEDFQDYIIPLAINPQPSEFGEGVEYNQSTYFENLFLDIYPFPTGASISSIELCIKHKPSNAFSLNVLGGDLITIDPPRNEAVLFPIIVQNEDDFVNFVSSGVGGYSLIEEIPHGYGTPETLKTNYSRRWRAVEGITSGPFDPNQFGFGFENPQLDSPFIDGHFDLNYVDGNVLTSRPLRNYDRKTATLNNVSIEKNLGFRFKNSSLFNTVPGRAYRSIDNGNIVDAYDNVAYEGTIDLPFSAGGTEPFALFVRFSIGSGNPIIFNSSIGNFSLRKQGNQFIFTYLDNQSSLRDIFIPIPPDSIYPVSMIITYREKNNDVINIYTKFEDNEQIIKSVSLSSFSSVGADVRFNTNLTNSLVYLHEFAISYGNEDGSNILDGDIFEPNLLFRQQTAQSFLRAHSVHWHDNLNPLPDSNVLPTYVDNSIQDWNIGEFDCSFDVAEFSGLTKRSGRDAINFHFVHDGTSYSDNINFPLPNSIDDTVSYHTQIENDFLRFSLNDVSENFFAIHPRIHKDLPKGYLFTEKAIAVESIIDYSQSGILNWPDGNVGAKLIVSLYTTNKDVIEPVNLSNILNVSYDVNKLMSVSYVGNDTSQVNVRQVSNIGLINRSIHYLEPNNECIIKLNSVFDPQNFFDDSEQWSLFSSETILDEFNHRFFSKDLNNMFLQYDLVLPSGLGYDINLNLHAANIRLENSHIFPGTNNNSLNLAISDADQVQAEFLNLVTDSVGSLEQSMSLYTDSFIMPEMSGEMNMFTDGVFVLDDSLSLTTITTGLVEEPSLFLNTSGNLRIEENINLFAFNNQQTLPSDLFLSLSTFASSPNSLEIFNQFNLLSFSSLNENLSANSEQQVNMFTFGTVETGDIFVQEDLNLFTKSPQIVNNDLNLVLFGNNFDDISIDNNFSLFSFSFPRVFLNGSGNEFIEWNGANPGVATEEQDEFRFIVPSTDQIRDVDTICFGDCSQDSGRCVEEPLITHDINWLDLTCVPGGIVRGSNPYFSDDNDLFFGTSGVSNYQGHIYGIRKLQGLIPNAPYFINVEGRRGNEEPFEVPRLFEEWEYGTVDDIAYSGIVLKDFEPSGNERFGHSVATDKNLLAISSPFANIGPFQDAGCINVYRRDETGPGDKGGWTLEQKVTLPTGYISDYFFEIPGQISFPGIGTIPERQYVVGQEGRKLGFSLDIAASGDREVIVAGGPGAQWTVRSFEEIVTSGVNIGIMIVNNEFEYTNSQVREVLRQLETSNFLYEFFADPPVEINVNLIAVVPTGIFSSTIQVDPDIQDILTVKTVPRQILGQNDPLVTQEILQGIQDAFFEAFPFDNTQINNNIPPLFGFYVDRSRSLGRSTVEPAIDQFVDFYNQYSFQSGVKDFFGNQTSGSIFEFVPSDDNAGEEWFDITNDLITELLDTGRLVESEDSFLITSGVGLEFANEDARIFNNPPDSGGRAYVFEKETEDEWSLIQILEPQPLIERNVNSRFGHAVGISDDANVVSVGSPFLEESCNIYEFNPNERNRLYDNIGNFLDFAVGSGDTPAFSLAQIRYNELINSGFTSRDAGREIYLNNLDTTQKLDARIAFGFWGEFPIQEYQNTFTYGLNDVRNSIAGTFTQIPLSGAPNPRLGYSTALNEDGSIVAFGSPTDSMGPYDNADLYFLQSEGFYVDPDNPNTIFDSPPAQSWPSNVNAGAVRIFERQRRVLPISTVGDDNQPLFVEYNRFGNLSNTLNNTEGFDQFGNPTNSTFISQFENYLRTPFDQTAIPRDASAAFIITPEIDAANDEVIQEIKDFLAQGDRKLILVGDDPIWENNGAYSRSNEIINTILERLGSRMRLHGAKNEREALVLNNICSGVMTENITESYTPVGSNATTIDAANNLHAFGVGDIRLHIPDLNFGPRTWGLGHVVVNNKLYGRCSSFNPICGPPIAHEGDLRARWTERERRFPTDSQNPFVFWERNVPFEFLSVPLPGTNPEIVSEIAQELSIAQPNEQPRPIMVAAEFQENFRDIPARPELTELREITEQRVRETNDVVIEYMFDDDHIDQVDFIWSEESGVFNFVNTNITDNQSPGIFFNPEPFNSRDSILQASGLLTVELEEFTDYSQVDDNLNIAVRDQFGDSEIFLIASVDSESSESLQQGNDENISFYDNIVRQPNCDTSQILQLGGWTGVNSFDDGFEGSLLKTLFTFFGHQVEEGFSLFNIPDTRDVVWIANTSNNPTLQEVEELRRWLNLGNKKLVITYDGSVEKASAAYSICNQLQTNVEPWLLSGANIHPVYRDDIRIFPQTVRPQILRFNEDEQAIASCDGSSPVTEFTFNNIFVPIRIFGDTSSTIMYYDALLNDERLAVDRNDVWRMNTGVSQVQFPAMPGSGYRIFYNWFSDFPGETQPLDIYVGDIHHRSSSSTLARDPNTVSANGNIRIFDYDVGDELIEAARATVRRTINSSSFGSTTDQGFFDVQVPADQNYINFFITGNREQVLADGVNIPRTARFLSVSGCPLPITRNERIITNRQVDNVVVGFEEVVVQEFAPVQRIFSEPTIQPIMNDNTRYCLEAGFDETCGNQLVADGPVVVAEEPETFSDFAFGNERSKIVLIADSSLINGCLSNIGNINNGQPLISGTPLIDEQVFDFRRTQFINSIISSTAQSQTFNGFNNKVNSNGYDFVQKVISPERGSPYIYGRTNRFGGSSTSHLLNSFVDESDLNEDAINASFFSENEFDDALERVFGEFEGSIGLFGTTRLVYESGGQTFIDSKLEDVPISDFMRLTGKDLLDREVLSEGYPGDLFGYSLDIHDNQMIIGSPYSSYNVSDIIKLSGITEADRLNIIETNQNGGAGNAYVFRPTLASGWVAQDKLHPDLGNPKNLGDRFGSDISMDSDLVAIGAPGHEFGVEITQSEGAFARKEFNAEFDIPERIIVSDNIPVSGNGAVFTFEDFLFDIGNRLTEWTFVEKLIAQEDREQENLCFGGSVSLNRYSSENGDYILAIGAPKESSEFSSGVLTVSYQPNNILNVLYGSQVAGELEKNGSSYTFDGILRHQPPSIIGDETFLAASIFGQNREFNEVNILIDQFNSDIVRSSGLVYTDQIGQIFIEASGQDSRDLGFIDQRPYVSRVFGNLFRGEPVEEHLSLFTSGQAPSLSEDVNLITFGPDSDNVYNTMPLTTISAFDASGEMNLFSSGIMPEIVENSDLFLLTSGIAMIDSPLLPMRIRGK